MVRHGFILPIGETFFRMARIEVASEFTTLAQDISSTTLVVSQYEFSFWIISRDQEEYILKIYYKNKLKKKKKKFMS